jgi:hypothetical protein
VAVAAATERKEKGRMKNEKTGTADIFPVHPVHFVAMTRLKTPG